MGVIGSTLNVKKTDETVKVPLLPQAQILLDKYKDQITSDDYLFPVCSNQKINKYLKEVMLQLKIKKDHNFSFGQAYLRHNHNFI